MRLVIEMKRNVNTQIVINQLFKHTELEATFGIINLALVDGQPKVLNLKEIISLFVKHRLNVVTKRIQFDLKNDEARVHIVEGLLIAQANIDNIIKIIRASQSTDEARDKLMSTYKLSEKQAQAILDMALKRLTALEKLKLEEELAELQKRIAYYKDLLANPKKILALIKEDLIRISEKYGDARRSEIIGKIDDLSMDEDDLIHDENMIISITTQGFIKRVQPSSYRAQGRGGVGVQSSNNSKNEEHYVEHLFVASTKDYVILCTNKGKAFWMKVHEIPMMNKTSQGKSIKFILNLTPDENVTSYVTVKNFGDDHTLMMITKRGTIKKMLLSVLENAKKRGVLALKLDNDDDLVGIDVVEKGDDYIMTTRNGLALRVSEEKIRKQGRVASGVKGITLNSGDECVSGNALRKGRSLIVITENGIGKRLSAKQFNVKGRGGKGQIYMKIDNKTGFVARVKTVGNDDDIMIVTTEDMMIKVQSKDIPELGRNAKGVKVVNVKSPVKVSDLAIVDSSDKEKDK